MPPGNLYGILVTPTDFTPWQMNSNYQEFLWRHRVQLTRISIPYYDVPRYLCREMARAMIGYEGEHGAYLWFSNNGGIVTWRSLIHDCAKMVDITEDEYNDMRPLSVQFAKAASDCSPIWAKW
jgi:hypothetical protein